MRALALYTLGGLEATTLSLERKTLAQHADVVIARLEDPHWVVRQAAITTLYT